MANFCSNSKSFLHHRRRFLALVRGMRRALTEEEQDRVRARGGAIIADIIESYLYW